MYVLDFLNSEKIPIFPMHADAIDALPDVKSSRRMNVSKCQVTPQFTSINIFCKHGTRECVRGLKSRSTRVGPIYFGTVRTTPRMLHGWGSLNTISRAIWRNTTNS